MKNDLKLDQFNEFLTCHRETVNSFLYAAEPVLCDYNFTNLYCWGLSYQIGWLIHDCRLLIFDGRDNYLLFPLGQEPEVSHLLEYSDQMIDQGKSGDFFLIPPGYVEKNREKLQQHFILEIDESLGDYVYSVKKLVELKGSRLHKKKNLVSQFDRNYPDALVKKLERENFRDCLELTDIWCSYSESCGSPEFEKEDNALHRALDSYESLGLDGIGLFIKDTMIAFSIFDRLNSRTADIHFEKSNPEIKGASQKINRESALVLADAYDYVNREQDMGIPGLRQAKRSYDPEMLSLSYSLIRKK